MCVPLRVYNFVTYMFTANECTATTAAATSTTTTTKFAMISAATLSV